ncbi:MAG TPA: DUF3054 domain-containing protein [Rhodococcus sp. (in: high G+C Gram-positive bacteria)]|nr:DUF3054 domain-containing protein [Rhodococcus sp. (in: high G+C Gram-positive bacteria)]
MRRYAPALVIDVILVIVFASLGRSSHDEALDLVGLAGTAWPFLGGLTIGWFLTAWLRRDKFDAYAAVPTGLVLWVSALVGGMLLRALTGQGTATAFVIVATLFLGAVLVGWRIIAQVIIRRRVSAG